MPNFFLKTCLLMRFKSTSPSLYNSASLILRIRSSSSSRVMCSRLLSSSMMSWATGTAAKLATIPILKWFLVVSDPATRVSTRPCRLYWRCRLDAFISATRSFPTWWISWKPFRHWSARPCLLNLFRFDLWRTSSFLVNFRIKIFIYMWLSKN